MLGPIIASVLLLLAFAALLIYFAGVEDRNASDEWALAARRCGLNYSQFFDCAPPQRSRRIFGTYRSRYVEAALNCDIVFAAEGSQLRPHVHIAVAVQNPKAYNVVVRQRLVPPSKRTPVRDDFANRFDIESFPEGLALTVLDSKAKSLLSERGVTRLLLDRDMLSLTTFDPVSSCEGLVGSMDLLCSLAERIEECDVSRFAAPPTRRQGFDNAAPF
jgi:hypothetical protein